MPAETGKSPKPSYDVVIIGGGPAGTVLGNLLGRAGHDVALFEKRSFPRFHVGESLIPAANATLEKLGLLEKLDRMGCPRKHGVQFFTRNGPSRPFYFSESRDARHHHTWQVLRSAFDELLLDEAVQAGVEAYTSMEVVAALLSGDALTGVRVRGGDDEEMTISARVVVDASGQRGLLAQRFGERMHIADLENASVFAHFEGARLDAGRDAGSTLIYRLEGRAWIWFIPLGEVTSIGLVAPAGNIASFGRNSEAILESAIASCELLAQRLSGARRTTDAHFVRDFSYRASVDGGPGWLLVGDALGFIDPVYSTGLFLALRSAELAAGAIEQALRTPDPHPDLAGFSSGYQSAFDRLLPLVLAFYDEGFRFGPLTERAEHRQGLVDLLIGDTSTQPAMDVSRHIADLLTR